MTWVDDLKQSAVITARKDNRELEAKIKANNLDLEKEQQLRDFLNRAVDILVPQTPPVIQKLMESGISIHTVGTHRHIEFHECENAYNSAQNWSEEIDAGIQWTLDHGKSSRTIRINFKKVGGILVLTFHKKE
jgi:hypothetical protein